MGVCCCEGVCSDRTCMRARMIVAPRGTVKGWGRLFRWVVEDIHRELFMFSPKFSDEEKVSDTIEGPLNLEDEMGQYDRGGVSCVITTIGLYSDDEMIHVAAIVGRLELKCIPTHEGGG